MRQLTGNCLGNTYYVHSCRGMDFVRVFALYQIMHHPLYTANSVGSVERGSSTIYIRCTVLKCVSTNIIHMVYGLNFSYFHNFHKSIHQRAQAGPGSQLMLPKKICIFAAVESVGETLFALAVSLHQAPSRCCGMAPPCVSMSKGIVC
jgi:hypothetical protein